jgi:RNA polymerase sigma-70 factor (ECF subfamily)
MSQRAVAPQTDAEIVDRVLGGDRNSYARLVDAYGERIVNYVARMTGSRYEAEDIAQEAFVRAYCALDSYNPDYKFSTWLFRIAHNQCINYLKKRNRLVHMGDYQHEDGEPAWVLPDTRPARNPAVAAERHDVQRQVQAAIVELPEAYRTVVILRHLHGMSYQEIADVIEVPIGTVKSRLGRGRSRLAALLEGQV